MKIKKKNNIGLIVRDFNIGGIQRFVSHLASNLNNEIYNITHERAEIAWKNYKDFYNKFDCIITLLLIIEFSVTNSGK